MSLLNWLQFNGGKRHSALVSIARDVAINLLKKVKNSISVHRLVMNDYGCV
jgi:hypothetical protein